MSQNPRRIFRQAEKAGGHREIRATLRVGQAAPDRGRRRRRSVSPAAEAPPVPGPGQGLALLGRGWQRVHRLLHRERRELPRPRSSRDHRRDPAGPRGRGHLQRGDGVPLAAGRSGRRGGSLRREDPVCQQRHRGDHGRHPHRPGLHREAEDPEVRRPFPRHARVSCGTTARRSRATCGRRNDRAPLPDSDGMPAALADLILVVALQRHRAPSRRPSRPTRTSWPP